MSSLPVFFSVVEPSGRVRQTGVHSDPAALVFLDCLVVYRQAPDDTYYRAGDFVPYPPKPSFFHEFDYAAEEWFDPRSLDELRAARWGAIKARRAALEASPVDYLGVQVQADAESVRRILLRAERARQALAAGEELETIWITADNGELLLDAEQMAAMPAAIDARSAALHEIAQGLRAELESAGTPAEVEVVRWPLVEADT